MKIMFSHQISEYLQRGLLGEFVIYDNQAKQKSFTQDLNDW
jgi:hypothetical protein